VRAYLARSNRFERDNCRAVRRFRCGWESRASCSSLSWAGAGSAGRVSWVVPGQIACGGGGKEAKLSVCARLCSHEAKRGQDYSVDSTHLAEIK
jgi:hypothetical protein